MKIKFLNVILLSILCLSSCNNSSNKEEIIQPFSIKVQMNQTTTLNYKYQSTLHDGQKVNSQWFEYNLLKDCVRIESEINNICININSDMDLSYTLQECFVKNLDIEAYRTNEIDYEINNNNISFTLNKRKHDEEDAILHFYKLNFEIDENNAGFFYFGVTYGNQIHSYHDIFNNENFCINSFTYLKKIENNEWKFTIRNEEKNDYIRKLFDKMYFVTTKTSAKDYTQKISLNDKNIIEVNDLYEGNNYKILTKCVMKELILTFMKEEVDFGYVCPWFNEIKAKDIDKITINSYGGLKETYTFTSNNRIYINKFYNFLKNTLFIYDYNYESIKDGGGREYIIFCGDKTYSFSEIRGIKNETQFSPYYMFEGEIPIPK